MKKRILATVLGLALLLMAGMAAFAADVDGTTEWEVRYDGGKDLQTTYSLSSMAGEAFKLQPGDTIELTANLHNNDSAASNWYMSNAVESTLEQARESATGGAYTYRLTYQGPNDSTELDLYNSDSVGGDQAAPTFAAAADNRIGLMQATEGLESFLYLDTLAAGQRGVVKLYITLDGESQGNSYQVTLARLQLNFAVDPVISLEETQSQTRTEQREIRIVQTGDTNEALPFIILAGISGLLLLAFGLFGLGEKKRAKKAAKQLVCLMLAGVLALSMPAAFGLAVRAEGDGEANGGANGDSGLRTYKVRLYPGKQDDTAEQAQISVTVSKSASGTAVLYTAYPDENGVVELTDVPYGYYVNFIVTDPKDDYKGKYYIEGVRVSGEDNDSRQNKENRQNKPSFQVTCDADYVIGYGIKGERVQYTLRFVDTEGNKLRDDIVNWGNVGDKPIVACQYIEGYRPNALNMTGTLKPLEAGKENIFEFVYTPLDTDILFIDGGVTYIDGGVTVIEGGAPGGGAGGGAPAGPAAPGGEELPEEAVPLAPPEEIVDLDEQKTPLAGMMNDFASSLLGLPLPAKMTLIGGAVALGAFIILAIVKKRKEEDAAEGLS